jgi:hypothetical protein
VINKVERAGGKMTIREAVKHEIDILPDDALDAVRDFVLFQKYRTILEIDDTTYLNAIPGMADSIKQGIETTVSECIPLAKVWVDE